ncbi:MAG: hypothetical protein H6696_00280 [Deferribacteres bacterium]|nr:hypothetical protein [candidate division KSB1 bacterium]MCB9500341.1 hypothetical protein [Deferribacteres bacterium]
MGDKSTGHLKEEHFSTSREKELTARYFRYVDERIPAAKSIEHAQEICAELNQAFRDECISEILHDFLEYHCTTTIAEHWAGSNEP